MQCKIIKQGTIEGTDIESENVTYVFTEEEKEYLRKELEPVIEASIENALTEHDFSRDDLSKQKIKNIMETCIDPFMITAESACNWMMWMKNAPSRQDHREKLADMLKSFKRTIHYLRQIYNMKVYIPLQREITDPLLPTLNPACFAAKGAVIKARKTEQHLESIVKIIEKYQRPKAAKGSPGNYTTDFAISIASAYYFYFRVKPTGYFNGPFVKLFQKLLDISGFDYRDNSRAIRAAVKHVEKEFTNE